MGGNTCYVLVNQPNPLELVKSWILEENLPTYSLLSKYLSLCLVINIVLTPNQGNFLLHQKDHYIQSQPISIHICGAQFQLNIYNTTLVPRLIDIFRRRGGKFVRANWTGNFLFDCVSSNFHEVSLRPEQGWHQWLY